MRLRGAQMADPEMTSALTMFRRAANIVARLEDAVVFRGLVPDPANSGRFRPPLSAIGGLQPVWEIGGGEREDGLWALGGRQWLRIRGFRRLRRGGFLVHAVSEAIGILERNGHFGPFAVVLDQGLFLIAQTPDQNGYVLPQDRIIPFLGGGSLLRSSTLDNPYIFAGLVLALGAAPFELVVATGHLRAVPAGHRRAGIPLPCAREDRASNQGDRSDRTALYVAVENAIPNLPLQRGYLDATMATVAMRNGNAADEGHL